MKSSVSKVGVALGSNLGNRLRHLQDARDLLKNLAAPGSFRQAPVYQTEPVACPPDSPDFYNTVVEFDYAGTAHDLLDATQGIEFRLGRAANPERNAPRVIDVDILYFGDERIDGGILDLPHPRLTSRRFVLQPLTDLHPELVLPGDQVSIAEHLRHLDSEEPPLATVQAVW
ncbi:2-amino-4-hydroxy-6-hydroxymethyldihydropteridine diphosphokinase [Luteolibacter arcticus]|uniref:2-amino-4-hydroxy-6-hydroxymethyldihydropteridine diphosphokinase n=1 Tax=Luteolibacter arcticus TaxID=1581411 RepID=A0ABT3GIW2_9BACT|nr:2-amino-4-hydroxy-6-hydroxymethyldihydropteridine diphosphokinase [Luteolibacter arcticus]MCW1923468.1 2-amino-4-hydroxy-6-hydroxymethyldihydropteridine diphosphokinase [Luteolibacter arcticus]